MADQPKQEPETRRVAIDLPTPVADEIEKEAKENYRTMRAECARRLIQSTNAGKEVAV